MKKQNGITIKRVIKQLVLCISSGLVFSLLGGLAAYVYLSTRYEYEPWHLIALNEEFRASRIGEVSGFDDYLRLEERLFEELREKVYMPPTGLASYFNRYSIGSRSDSFELPVNWNKSFELPVENSRGGFLMLHGLTDSPYSVRSLAEKMQAQGFWVVGLRLPGHGTIPGELLNIHWQDWAAAVRIGARRVEERIGGELPLYILGYSNGAALAVEYALSVIDGKAVPRTNGLFLLSPALRLQPVATMAKFQLGLSRLPGLGKLAWESVELEYDPYKYNSFPVNAGEETYQLALNIQERVEEMARTSRLAAFPKVIAFQSIVDGTIQAEGIVDNLLRHLPSEENTLVVYDVNQGFMAAGLLADAGESLKSSLLEKELPFGVEFVTNMTDTQSDLRVVYKKAQQASTTSKQIPFSWPSGIYSLSHVALPFPPDDPIYGESRIGGSGPIRLGNISLRGEKKVFAIPEQNLMRLRHNPFYAHTESRLLRFLGGADDE